MIEPIFWLGLSILLVAISLTALLIVAIPAFQELGRASRSAEKLFDTLQRELPPTLEAIRLTGLEITELTDDMSQGVQSAGQVAKQVDQSISGVKQQVQKANSTTRSLMVGMRAAWRTLTQPTNKSRRGSLPGGSRSSLPYGEPRQAYTHREDVTQPEPYFDDEIEAVLDELTQNPKSVQPREGMPSKKESPLRSTDDFPNETMRSSKSNHSPRIDRSASDTPRSPVRRDSE